MMDREELYLKCCDDVDGVIGFMIPGGELKTVNTMEKTKITSIVNHVTGIVE